MSNSLILIDEGTLAFGNRDWKTFGRPLKEFFLLHGHYKCDIAIFTQKWDGIDVLIRSITERVFYIQRAGSKTKYWKIPHGFAIPTKKQNKEAGRQLGPIEEGYCKPPFLYLLFLAKKFYRRPYYKFFDSYAAPTLPPFPAATAPPPQSESQL